MNENEFFYVDIRSGIGDRLKGFDDLFYHEIPAGAFIGVAKHGKAFIWNWHMCDRPLWFSLVRSVIWMLIAGDAGIDIEYNG